MLNYRELSAVGIGKLIANRQVSVNEVVKNSLESIDKLNSEYNCFITINDNALKEAMQIQKRIDNGENISPLAGVPIGIKDNICTKNLRTTSGSKMLENFIPPYNGHVVDKMIEAGAIIIGKTNMDEFAMGSTTETSYFGAVRNPYNTAKVSGGSSGGSAAAVALGLVPLALGSDTGGSVRQPASHCGIMGLKPTYGRVSRYGLIAYGSSLDQIGPMGKTVEDLAVTLGIIGGYDVKDSTSCNCEVQDYMEYNSLNIKGLRIGIPADYMNREMNPKVRAAVYAAAEKLMTAGAVVEEFSLGMADEAVPAYYVIACGEASSNLERYDGIKYGYRVSDSVDLNDLYKNTRTKGFGIEAKRRIMLGTFVLSQGYYEQYYVKALKVKELVKQAFYRAYEKYDVILAPAVLDIAPDLGMSLNDNIKMYKDDVFTVGANLAGIPALSIPVTSDELGMPIGVQLMAREFEELTLFRTAKAMEDMS